MDFHRIDIISIIDLDFYDRINFRNLKTQLRHLIRKDEDKYKDKRAFFSEIQPPPSLDSYINVVEKVYRESFKWIFYGDYLPQCIRYYFPPPRNKNSNDVEPNLKGASLLINLEQKVGVYSIWQQYYKEQSSLDPIKLKLDTWQSTRTFRAYLKQIGIAVDRNAVEEVERHYPFVSIQISNNDLNQFVVDHAEEIGRLFTSNLEHEPKEILEGYIKQNISTRAYERILIRWTEGLAIYSSSIEKWEYEYSLFRIVQIFEICVLIRRMLRSLSKKIDKIYPTVNWFRPRPYTVNSLLQSLATLEKTFITAPPIQSVEAERLINDAYRSFGISIILESTKKSAEVLERRYQWATTQLLVAIGVLTYAFDKVFELIKDSEPIKNLIKGVFQ